MAVKFPLEMKDGTQVRNINELKENFDIEKVMGYFLDGKLLTWLNARYYEEEAEIITGLHKNDPQLAQKLCNIFGVEYQESVLNLEEIARRNERIAILKQYTNDDNIIKVVDFVAFNQEELAELYDNDIEKIYLCAGDFIIPKSKRNLEYVIIGECNVKGLTTKEEIEHTEEKHDEQILDEMVIKEKLIIEKEEVKEYKNVTVIINNEIECKGILQFDNCKVYCNGKNLSITKTFGRKNIGVLNLILGGKVIFNKCEIIYNCNEDISFVSATFEKDKAKVEFNACNFVNCKMLISEVGNVSFHNCIGVDIQNPMLYNTCEIRIENCEFTAQCNSMAPLESLHNMDNKKFLFKTTSAYVSNATFKGFVQGVIFGDAVVKIIATNFNECSGISKIWSGELVVENCKFERCIELFDCSSIKMQKCEFEKCYGQITANQMHLEYCNWNNGLVYLYSNGRIEGMFGPNIEMKYCIYKNCDYKASVTELINHKENNYQYYTFMTEGEVEAIFSDMRYLISGNELKITTCQFIGIKLENVKRMIEACSGYIEKSNFEEIIPRRILEEESYTVCGMGFFAREKIYKRYYHVENCKGLRDPSEVIWI